MSIPIDLELKVKFKTEIDDCSLDELETDSAEYLVMENIQEFITEFIKHPKAVLKYYGYVLIETLLKNEYIDFEKIKGLLDYQYEPNDLFIRIAANCQPTVKTFITNLYTQNKALLTDGQKGTNQFFREKLEDHFHPLRIDALSFNFMDESSEGKNDETSKNV